MDFELKELISEHLIEFKKSMQEAFQKGAEEGTVSSEFEVLPESHIDRNLCESGAVAYEDFVDGQAIAGAIVTIDVVTKHNHLDFLFVKYGTQSKGVGQKIWNAIEQKYPDTKVWETCTPYFEKRNIHFYVNRCGFHIVEFYNKNHPDPNDTDECMDEEYFDGMFRFEKIKRQE